MPLHACVMVFHSSLILRVCVSLCVCTPVPAQVQRAKELIASGEAEFDIEEDTDHGYDYYDTRDQTRMETIELLEHPRKEVHAN